MPATVPRTYGKKVPIKRKTSPSSDESDGVKRRKVTPSDGEREAKPKPKRRSPSPPPAKPANATPTKMTKRMLGRSKTESSIDGQPSASVGSRTSSLPVIPSSSSQPPLDDLSHEPERRLALKTSTSTPRVKRTYAGSSRSFLVALPVSESTVPGVDGASQENDFYEPESYSSLRLRWGVDYSEDEPPSLPLTPSRSKSNSKNGTPSKKGKGKAAPGPSVHLPPNMMNPLKSITELRSKGESRRFLDEVGYLFEGMDPSNSVGLKRSSASEITAKLCDDEFARKAKAADFYHKAWDVFLKAGAGRGEDKILDILLVFLVALVARNTDTLLDLINQEPITSTSTSDTSSSFTKNGNKGKDKEKSDSASTNVNHPDTLINILFFTLKNSGGVDPLAMISPTRSATDLEFKQIGLSKKDKIMLSTIYSTISTKANLFPSGTPITTTLLTTHILQTLPSHLLPQAHVPDLLHSLRSLLRTSFPLNQPFNGAYPSSNHLDDDDGEEIDEPQYQCLKNHLHLLDMYLLGQWSTSNTRESDGGSSGETSNAVGDRELSELNAARDEWFVDGLIAVGVCAEMKLRRKYADGGDDDNINLGAVSHSLEILLRVFVNLTHGDQASAWAQSIVSNGFGVAFIIQLLASSSSKTLSSRSSGHELGDDIKPKLEDDFGAESQSSTTMTKEKAKADSSSSHAWDRLCLTLGLLTNLVQSLPDSKNVLRQTKISPNCTLSNPSCTLKKCTCHTERMGSLELLAGVYNSYSSPPSARATTTSTKKTKVKREASPSPSLPSRDAAAAAAVAEADTSLILGTLSILFGLLMSSSPQNQAIILASIVNNNRIHGGNSSSMNGSGSERRGNLDKLVDQAKDFVAVYAAMSGGERGRDEEEGREVRSAKEVVRVLERLRDDCRE